MTGHDAIKQSTSADTRNWLKTVGMPVMVILLLACVPFAVGCSSEQQQESDRERIASQTYDDGRLRWDIARVDGRWFWLYGGNGHDSSTSQYDTVTYMRCEDGVVRANLTYATALEFAFDAEEGGDAWATRQGGVLTLHLPPSAAE